MSETVDNSLSPDQLQAIDDICDKFDDEWSKGQRAVIEDCIAQIEEPVRTVLLSELIQIELEWRFRHGETPLVDEYRGRFSSCADAIESWLNAARCAAQELYSSRRTAQLQATAPADAMPPASLTSLEHYELLEELGRGAMGVVYKARHRRLKRLAAIKIIHGGPLAGAEHMARFRREAEAVARVQHPNIVQIYEVGEKPGSGSDGPTPFLALEYVDGGTLRDRLVDQSLTTREAAALILTLARGVQAAHAKGLVHRDLKPANILLTQEGTAKIADFGLAKHLDEGDQTQTGQILGTPSYMAPEQAAGQRHAVGPAADIYALGAILFELLTGRPPFRATTVMQTLDQVRTQEPVRPRQLRPKTPRDLETICLTCLQKEPGKRYASAQDLAEDLERFQNGVPIRARPVGRLERAWRWCRRNPIVSGLVAALLLVLTTGMIISTLLTLQANRDAEAAREAEGNVRREATAARRAEAAARHKAYHASMLLVQSAWEHHLGDRMRDLLLAQHPQAGQDDLRGFEWYYWQRQYQRVYATLELERQSFKALSPDCKTVATSSRLDGPIEIWDIALGRVTKRLQGKGEASPAFSPDGKWLAVSAPILPRVAHNFELGTDRVAFFPQTVQVWDLATDRVAFDLQGYHPTFSPDSKLIATTLFSPPDALVKVWDTATRHEILTIRINQGRGPGATGSLAFSPDGKKLATGTLDGAKVWDLATGQQTLSLNGHTKPVYSVAFSPDGKRLAGASQDKTTLWDTNTGQQAVIIEDRGVRAIVLFSPDGKRFATTIFDERLSPRIRVFDATTGTEKFALNGNLSLFGFTPDGKRLALATRKGVEIWDLDTEQEYLTLRGHHGPVASVAFSPDNDRLASTARKMEPGEARAEVKVWDASAGQEVFTFEDLVPLLGSENGNVAYSPNGKWLAGRRIWDACNNMKVWDAPNGWMTGAIGVGNSFSPDSKRLATRMGDSQRASLTVWDVVTGDRVLTIVGQLPSFLHGVAFSPDGKRLASGCSSDGLLPKSFMVWDAATGQTIFALEGHTDSVFCVAFSPDGKWIATGSGDATIKLWDAETGQERHTLRGHKDIVTSVAFSPDTKRLASGSHDKTIKLWDTALFQEVLTLRGHTAEVLSVAFSHDGKRLASGSKDGTIKLWSAATEH